MKKLLTFVLLCLLLASCSLNRPVKNCDTFAEMDDPITDTTSNWNAISKQGLIASFVNIDHKYPKSVLPHSSIGSTIQEVVGWRGEKLSAQILLWSATDVEQVEVEFSDFEFNKSILPASIAQARFVRYVMTDEFAGGCGYRKPEDFASVLAPDMLDNVECFDIAGQTVRPVWVTLDIPRDAKVGLYKGDVKIYAKDTKTKTLR